jgi:serine/threonine protein kinase
MTAPPPVLVAALADHYLKVLRTEVAAALGATRFLAEIRTTARLQHPHILPLLDSGDAGNGLLYYVMPVVTGETLRARLDRETQLPLADVLRIADQVASALDYAHRQGVVDRDIKPENILLHEGQALVADFGIAIAPDAATAVHRDSNQEEIMPLYLTRFSYTPETWARLIDKPEDRRAAAKTYIESVGGTLHGFWYAFGTHDGYNLWEAPDNVSMAAVALAISAGGALSSYETTVLLTVEETMEALRKAGQVRYRPPGA